MTSQPNKQSQRLGCCWGVFFLLFLGGGAAWANKATTAPTDEEKACLLLAQQKKWERAARCLEKAEKILAPNEKTARTRFLQQAIRYWEQASKGASLSATTLYRRKALRLLRRLLEEGLCPQPASCQQLKKKQTLLKKQLGYVRLTIRTHPSRAEVELQGKNKTFVNYRSGLLAPGEYQIQVSAKGWHSQKQTVRLLPGKPQRLRIALQSTSPRARLPAPRRRPPSRTRPPLLFPWLIAGTGVVTLLSGGILLLVSKNTETRVYAQASEISRQLQQNLQPHDIQTLQIVNLHQTAIAQNTTGWILLGSGATVTLVGALLFLIRPSRSTTASLPQKGEIPLCVETVGGPSILTHSQRR